MLTYGKRYLTLIEKFADKKQKQEAIEKTASWLKAHPDDSMVRTKYIKTIAQRGTLRQKQKIIYETGVLATKSFSASRGLQTILGHTRKIWHSTASRAEAIALTTSWLQENPEKGEIRKQYLRLLRQCDPKIADIDSIIRQQLVVDSAATRSQSSIVDCIFASATQIQQKAFGYYSHSYRSSFKAKLRSSVNYLYGFLATFAITLIMVAAIN